jgi:hypothetical protein
LTVNITVPKCTDFTTKTLYINILQGVTQHHEETTEKGRTRIKQVKEINKEKHKL